jgi:hypothetical protein
MAVKKNLQQSRKAFVQAKLGQTGVEATPEQKAKLRERFNTLSQTKQGRTKIAQALLPTGTAEQRKTLKASIRPPKTGTSTTGTSTTGTSTTGTSTTGKTNVGYVPGYTGIINNPSLPSNNYSSSTTVPSATKTTTTTVPQTTTTTTPRTTTTTTPRTTTTSVPQSNAFKSFGPTQTTKTTTTKTPSKDNKNVYGDVFEEKIALTLEKYKIPVFGRVAGIGRAIDAGDTKAALVGSGKAILSALVTGATLGTVKMGASAASKLNQAGVARARQGALQREFQATQALKANTKPPVPRPDFGSVAEQRAFTSQGVSNLRPQFGSVAKQRADAAAKALAERPVFGTVAQQRAAAAARKR